VAGVDASYHQGMVCAAVAVLDFPHLKPIEQAVVEIPFSFPYIPGLLSFRQAPGILAALKQLSQCRSLTGMARPTHAVLALPATWVSGWIYRPLDAQNPS